MPPPRRPSRRRPRRLRAPTQAEVPEFYPSVAPPDGATVALTCGDEIAFHPALLAQRGSAEGDLDPAAAAPRAELASAPPELGLPATGWVRVAQLADLARFVAPNGDGWAQVGVALRDGRWLLDLAGGCRLQPVVPSDRSVAEWWLDPDGPRPAPGDATIQVVLRERACAGGASPEGRLLPPAVGVTETAVVVALLVRRRPGPNDCTGNPEFATAIKLPQPLGARALFDGGVFPPRDAARPPSP